MSSLAVGTYELEIEVEVSNISKVSKLQSNYSIDSGTYQIGNKIYRIYNDGKGTSLKLEVSNIQVGNQQNHVDKAQLSSSGLYLYGWSFIEKLDMSNDNSVKKTVIFKNSNGQEVKRQVVKNVYHKEFADAYQAPYQYARYEQTIDVSSLAVGIYELEIEVEVSNISKVSKLQSNYSIDSGTYQIGNKIYRIYNDGKGTSLKLQVSQAKIGRTINHVDRASLSLNGLYLYGWAYTEGLDMSIDNLITKTVIFKNSNGQEVKRQTVKNVYHQEFADAYQAPYQYARYEQTIDVSSLAAGIYTIEIQVQGQNSTQKVNLSSNYSIDTGVYKINGKSYQLYNSGAGTTLKLIVK